MRIKLFLSFVITILHLIFDPNSNIFLKNNEEVSCVETKSTTDETSDKISDEIDFITEETTTQIIEADENIGEDRIFEHSFFGDFPRNANFVDDINYKIIKEAYDNFFSDIELKIGDQKLYDMYRKNFKRLLDNETAYYNPEEGKEIYPIESDWFDQERLKDEYGYFYWFFDIDDDNTPELCIHTATEGLHVFKYIENDDRFILWLHPGTPYISVYSTKTLLWSNYNEVEFYKLNESGEIIEGVNYLVKPINENNTTYMVSLPVSMPSEFRDQRNELDIELQKQGYIDRYNGIFYFRVTKDQYDELVGRINLNSLDSEVYFTYDELFGDL